MFVVSTCSPISVVENCSFRELCTALNPRYSATSNKKIKEIINATATQVRQHLKDLVRDQDCHLTTDLWQSITKNFFIAVTCHFIDKEWNIHSLTICVDKLKVMIMSFSEKNLRLLFKVLRFQLARLSMIKDQILF